MVRFTRKIKHEIVSNKVYNAPETCKSNDVGITEYSVGWQMTNEPHPTLQSSVAAPTLFSH